PDPGVPFQLVHHDDVATAMRAAVVGVGSPGAYNIAGTGRLTVSQLASELGWYSIPVPDLALDAAAAMTGRLGFRPGQAQGVAPGLGLPDAQLHVAAGRGGHRALLGAFAAERAPRPLRRSGHELDRLVFLTGDHLADELLGGGAAPDRRRDVHVHQEAFVFEA